MSTRTGDILDPSIMRADMRYSWTGYSPWSRWMNMGDRPGRTLWNSNGRKYANLDNLDSSIRRNFERAFPGLLDNPETYKKTGGLTSTG